MAGAVGAGVFGYAALMKAMRTGSISAVTPFRYTRMLFGITLGIVIFGERLDGPMTLGCVVIIGSGLLIWWQSKAANPRLDPDERLIGSAASRQSRPWTKQ